ncbi:MAG: hypothetical protein OXF83_10110 [Anaerolineaceae bacterium]|nr:hypothetical protein [Anaerolineaceae bacterium]
MSLPAAFHRESPYDSLDFRCIGPFRGGRVVAVTGDAKDPATFYFGAVGGGVWKTEDGGQFWRNVSDGYFQTAAVGALASSPSHPHILYAGTGETSIRIDVSHGDGVYRSADGGQSWQHMGLSDTRFIGKIVIHPQNPDRVYVAALGHAYGPNRERGVFRSDDGGVNWQQVLFRSEKAGAVDITMDRQNPQILYASFWECYRNFHQISSGGEDSSLYRSLDGGDTWEEITQRKGLPQTLLGKMGISASPAQSGRLWALIEAKKGQGLYRSDDYGMTWELLSDKPELTGRAWYYMHIEADPVDAESVYVMCFSFFRSDDGGRNWQEIGTPHGDNHALWIDPQDNRRMIEGNDGGACISYNRAASWSSIYNQPTAQIYHLDTDNAFHYTVHGTQQDNSAIAVPSATDHRIIAWEDCEATAFAESGYIRVHPQNDDVIFAGCVGSSPNGGGALARFDRSNGEFRSITVWPEMNLGLGAKAEKYRFAWTYPIVFSPHDGETLYLGGNQVFRSRNQGDSWEAISPDLTRADPATLEPSGGPINRDALGAEHYATVYSFAESPLDAGLFWAGSDDGLLHVSRDDGASWQGLSLPDLPEWTMIACLEPSPHDAATCYLAATGYKNDDFTPYLYITHDFGASWSRITNGIRPDDFTRVIRADPECEGLLFAGTETGLYASFDDGESWQPLHGRNLPVAPVYDLQIKRGDLIIGTHGRSFWILDDITPLREAAALNDVESHLFPPRDWARLASTPFEGHVDLEIAPGKNSAIFLGVEATFEMEKDDELLVHQRFLNAGLNPPRGVCVHYYLAAAQEEPIQLRFLDAAGNEIKTFTSKPPAEEEDTDAKPDRDATLPYLPNRAGVNRFVWDGRYPHGKRPTAEGFFSAAPLGPVAPPGEYQVQITVGEETQTRTFRITKDPRSAATDEDLQAQFELLLALRDKISETQLTEQRIRRSLKELKYWQERLKEGEIHEAATSLHEKLTEILEKFTPADVSNQYHLINQGARLTAKISALPADVATGQFAPTRGQRDVFASLCERIDAATAELDALLAQEGAAFNQRVQEAGLNPLSETEPNA